jgi:hypothetical protein
MQNRDEALALVTAIAVALSVATLAVILALLPPSGGARPVAADPGPNCAEWTDGCVICQRTASGPACSTPGIACTRASLQCLKRS